MAGDSAHDIVGNAGWNRAADPCWVRKERIEATVTSLNAVSCVVSHVEQCTHVVQINVDTAKVVEHKVSNGIRALDGVGIAVECLEEPWVLVGDELARLLVGPKLEMLA